MKALLVNSKTKEITHHELLDDPNRQCDMIRKLVGCDIFGLTQAYIKEQDGSETLVDVFVDDNGLLVDPEHFFMLHGNQQPLAGNGLVVGLADENDHSTDCPVGMLALAKNTVFLSLSEVRLMATTGAI